MTPSRGDRPSEMALGLLAILVALGACGTIEPPLEIASISPERSTRSSKQRPLALEAIEGRPNGLLLKLTARDGHGLDASGDTIEIVRRQLGDDDSRDVLDTFRLTSKTFERLTDDEGLTLLDRSLSPGALRYDLQWKPETGREKRAEPLPLVTPLRVRWASPPPRPTTLRAASTMPVAVELQWHPIAEGAIVFRRDVLDEDSKLTPIASLEAASAGLFVDRDVQPGGVYAYRVALSRPSSDLTQYGSPSRTLYVSVPEDASSARRLMERLVP